MLIKMPSMVLLAKMEELEEWTKTVLYHFQNPNKPYIFGKLES